MTGFRRILPFAFAAAIAVPGIVVRIAHVHLEPPIAAIVAGAAVLGAAFLLVWACDAAQADVSQTLALAAVALIAVLPEYAVDMYFTWQAGKFPASDYSQFAVANMTGANRLLIGVGWSAIAVLFWLRARRTVQLPGERRIELGFLAMATLYAFVIPLKGTLAWYDGVVFIGLYGWYIVIAARRPRPEEPIVGPAEVLVGLPKRPRRAATIGLLLFAGAAIVANAEPFCEGLVDTGKLLGINQFFLVQWLAPLASETPEFVLAIMFVLRGRPDMGLGSLLSSKLNQWTLLVGMIPAVFAVSHGSLDHPIPMGHLQMTEILLTAAQSLCAVVLLGGMTLSPGQALLLFGLFIGQFLTPKDLGSSVITTSALREQSVHFLLSILYVLVAIALVLDQPQRLRGLWFQAQGQHLERPDWAAVFGSDPVVSATRQPSASFRSGLDANPGLERHLGSGKSGEDE